MNSNQLRTYLPVILATCDRMLEDGPMMGELRSLKIKRRLAILRERDRKFPERAGIPLPEFLNRHL